MSQNDETTTLYSLPDTESDAVDTAGITNDADNREAPADHAVKEYPVPERKANSENAPAASAGNTSPAPDARTSTPFVVEIERQEEAGGHFRPSACLKVTLALRTSGLLKALPAEELRSLLFVLSFLSDTGDITPTVAELAKAMRVSTGTVRARMGRLLAFVWQDRPLLLELKRDSGLDAYTPSPHLIAIVHREAPEPPALDAFASTTTRREAVIAHSRGAYTRPRQEVERMIAEINGWELPGELGQDGLEAGSGEPGAWASLRMRLLLLGVSEEQADLLLLHFPIEKIAQQMDWLPYRNARNPARLLVAAIQGGYAPPYALQELPELPTDAASPSDVAFADDATATGPEPPPEESAEPTGREDD